MKLTPPDAIKESEREFIDTINAELDWEALETLIQEKHNFILQDDVQYKNGDLTVYNNQIAYQFEFEIKVPLTLICDRQGECLSLSSTREDDSDDFDDTHTQALLENEIDTAQEETDFSLDASLDLEDHKKKRTEELGSEIAQKITEINEG